MAMCATSKSGAKSGAQLNHLRMNYMLYVVLGYLYENRGIAQTCPERYLVPITDVFISQTAPKWRSVIP